MFPAASKPEGSACKNRQAIGDALNPTKHELDGADNSQSADVLCYKPEMRAVVARSIFTVTRNRDLWAVEHLGEYFDHSMDKSEARASANKRARQAQDAGQACQVRVSGETGYLQ
jgi:hypothetical protein